MMNIKNFGEYVSVYSYENDYFDKNKKAVVNWGAIGSVDARTAKAFVKNLQKAIAEVEKLNGAN